MSIEQFNNGNKRLYLTEYGVHLRNDDNEEFNVDINAETGSKVLGIPKALAVTSIKTLMVLLGLILCWLLMPVILAFTFSLFGIPLFITLIVVLIKDKIPIKLNIPWERIVETSYNHGNIFICYLAENNDNRKIELFGFNTDDMIKYERICSSRGVRIGSIQSKK